ncbi:hypothetical protein [Oryzicola mucosus]|uniref:Uncharacterized protein n=1 Tax=Oryzicola mucosus TaxID=2767425 RepID=A0A8J6PIS7_9HYPH|nr:hypothetical protein [Oryzicola mucosus]MBD0415684.1 hypothetical protein [Oryzicola mucosus]
MPKATIYIYNEDGNDLILTVVDNNTASGETVLNKQFIADNETIPITVNLNGSNEAVISWSAYRQNEPSKTGSEDKVEATDGLTVNIRIW